MYGGTGRSISKELALYAKDKIKFSGKEFFLAGGIDPENVCDVITTIQPDGIDVSSGVEESKGKKSRSKMEKLFHEIGNA
jgi:phosphoribosylanthranilate isomerase